MRAVIPPPLRGVTGQRQDSDQLGVFERAWIRFHASDSKFLSHPAPVEMGTDRHIGCGRESLVCCLYHVFRLGRTELIRIRRPSGEHKSPINSPMGSQFGAQPAVQGSAAFKLGDWNLDDGRQQRPDLANTFGIHRMDDDRADWRAQTGQYPRYFVSETSLTEVVVERDKVEVCLAK